MKIKSLTIDGFRCLQNLSISFEEDITVIVGENDSGKTSLVDCLKIITQNKTVELDDFTYGSNKIQLSIEIEGLIFKKTYEKQDGNIIPLPLEARPTEDYLSKIKLDFESEGFDMSVPENFVKVRNTAKLFGLTVRSNSNMDNLKEGVIEKVNECIANPQFKIDNAQFPSFNNIQLDGKQFENVSSFFKEVFLKEKQSDIWKETVLEGTTIEDFIRTKIDSYSEEISRKMNETGIKDKIRLFLKDLTDIRIEPIYQTRDLNIDAKVKFLENGTEINLQKKGDGTKRRITMALLEFKKDQTPISSDDSTIYLLDEPDTHLHVRAQIELLETLQTFAASGNQVILTTHSPFLINSVKPNQIRLLFLETQNCAKIKQLHEQATISANILQAIGIENVYLFFAKTIILVEGQTEQAFIENYFLRKKNRPINSNLIKIINVEGIHNIYGFAKGILELHNPDSIYIVFDNDPSEELRELIDRLGIPQGKKYIIGNKEFEDAFSDDVLYICWKKYQEDNGRSCPENWSIEKLGNTRKKCTSDSSLKFSKEIKQLNAGGKTMTKPIFGCALAQYIEDAQLPPRLNDLLLELSS